MIRKRVSTLSLLLLAIAVCTFCSCGGGNSTNISSITISPTSLSVALNSQADFSATVNLVNSTITTNTAVTWEVNGTVGGTSAVGTIISSPTDAQVGIYTAPATVPSTNNGQVSITAVINTNGTTTTSTTTSTTTTSSSTTTTTITSNTATATITGGVGLALSLSAATVPAGGSFQFVATNNGVTDHNATWSISVPNGGSPGTINAQSGLYTAPLNPPPGGMVTVTATDGGSSATAIATIVYSDHSLSGPYAFSYKGNDTLGFRAVAGSFVADGNGNITSGVEDIESFLTGISVQVPITGTYVVGGDGRTNALINPGLQSSATWQFALTSNTHAVMIRFNNSSGGSGSIDQQNLNALSNTASVISGPYVFGLSGTDSAFNPLGMAGEFSSSGNGTIPQSNTILDVNDNGSAATDRTLAGSYSFDPAFPGTGRGILTLTGTSITQRQFAFYVIDSTHAHLVETDRNAYTAGDVFSSSSGNSFTVAELTAGNYVFTSGGMSGGKSFAAAGVFASNGAGGVTSGALDTNSAGTAKLNTSLTSCAYTVDQPTGRLALQLCTAATTYLFAAYPASSGSVVLLELDSAALSTGLAYQQQTIPSTLTGNFVVNLAGQGLFHNAPAGSYQPDIEGQITFNGSGASSGNLDLNNFSAVFSSDAINVTNTAFVAAGANGRGTAALAVTSPPATYNVVFYLINASTALLIDSDTTLTLTGVFANQY